MSRKSLAWHFKPHPLFRGGHLQTFAGIYLPRRDAPYAATQHFVGLGERLISPEPDQSAGDQLVLHEDRPANWRPNDPTVLLIHGLAGCYRSTYMCRLAERMVESGKCVFRMDMRGCGAGHSVARTPTHCGSSGDVAAAVRFIADRYPESPTFVVGFSLGGALALRLLTEIGDEQLGNLQRVLAICPPLDLFAVEKRFNTPLGRPYDRFFVRLIWKQVLARWNRFPEIAPVEMPERPRRLRQIDEMIIAPAAGFKTADEYYAGTQVGPSLASIRQPATIIAAADDPIVPVESLHQYKRSDAVEPVVVEGGGHLGFIASANGDPDYRWLDWRILEWIESGH